MYILHSCSKTLREKIRDSMIILAEREANRILLSSDNLTRNFFIVKEKPKETLKNENWLKFLESQLKTRCIIKHRMYHVLPEIFPDLEKISRIKLANIMFAEIKRKRKMDITMKKTPQNSNIAFTSFQELVFQHSRNLISDKYSKLIDTGQLIWSAAEIIENSEVEVFKAFRTYTNCEET